MFALDLRGHGNSSHTQPYRYIDYIDDTVAFLEDVVGEKTSIYGASLGGMISLMVAAHRPEYVKVIVFGDANIKTEKVHKIMKDYDTFWSGWENFANLSVDLDKFVQMVAEMPIDIPWREPGKYGDEQDFITTLNKEIYLKNLDPAVLTPWANGGKNNDVFTEVKDAMTLRI
jgi:pimeloyl-ACP methyl ester carboxylesterase